MKRVAALLITLALIVGMVGCPAAPVQVELDISSTPGGSVTSPGEGTLTYEAGKVVDLVAEAEQGYRFVNWTGDLGTVGNVNSVVTTITMNGSYGIMANFVALYVLTIDSTQGGQVIMPGEGAFAYDTGTVVPLVAEAEDGYRFVKWIGDVGTVVYTTSGFATITMNDDYSVTAEFEELDPEKLFAGGSGTEGNPYRIADWYHLNNVRYFLGAHYRLMKDIDSGTAGYAEVASTTANHGKGWQPIGSLFIDPLVFDMVPSVDPFAGSFNGQGHEIRNVFINRPGESLVGLFADLDEKRIIENVALVSATVTGGEYVGSLVGGNRGGIVSNSHSSGGVTGMHQVGGLVGWNAGTLSASSFSGSVSGRWRVGGLVAYNHGIVSNSHFGGSLTGDMVIDGLVAENLGTVSNSYYSHDEVLINGENVITIGALPAADFEQWLANGMFLDVNERLSQEGGYYVISSVGDFKELLAFGQDSSLRFKLKNDLDLTGEANFYIPYLAGEFDGNGHRISNLSLNLRSTSHVGLFGHVAAGGKISAVGLESISIRGASSVGGLAGWNFGTVSNSYSSGSVTGHEVGGLVGHNDGTVDNSYFGGSVNGESGVGGLVGLNSGTVRNSHYDHDAVSINGRNVITIGALFDEDFEHWLASGKSLDVSGRLSQQGGYYVISSVRDFKELLAFGQDTSLKFRLKGNLDLANEPDLYIPYLAGEFDGDGHKIRNLSFGFDFVSGVAVFGHVGLGGRVSAVGAENVNVTGDRQVGGLVGGSRGTVDNSYSTGQLSGVWYVGGLVGANHNTVSNSYSTASVSGGSLVGGLVGRNLGAVNNCYSVGSVNGVAGVGGLVGAISLVASNSFWDVEASGTETSFAQGGAGKTTREMKSTVTFADVSTEGLDEPWDIIAVALGVTSRAYTWNIVDGQTYPFLSWQPVS